MQAKIKKMYIPPFPDGAGWLRIAARHKIISELNPIYAPPPMYMCMCGLSPDRYTFLYREKMVCSINKVISSAIDCFPIETNELLHEAITRYLKGEIFGKYEPYEYIFGNVA